MSSKSDGSKRSKSSKASNRSSESKHAKGSSEMKEHNNLDQFSLEKVILLLRQQLIQEKELMKPRHLNLQYVRRLILYIHKKFVDCDVDFNNSNDQENVIRNYLKSIIIPCFSLICELPKDVMWDFVMVIYLIMSSNIQFLAEDEETDILFRLINARAPLKYNVSIPIIDKIKHKIVENSLDNYGKYGISDASYFLKKLSESRLKKDDLIQQRTLAYYFFLEKFMESNPACFADGDPSWFINDLWPCRISSIYSEDEEDDDKDLEDFHGMLQLSTDKIKWLYKEKNYETINIEWTNGVIDKFDLKNLIDLNNNLVCHKDHIDILVHLLIEKCHLQTSDYIPDDWVLLVDIIKLHRIENGGKNKNYSLDIAYLLENCYKVNSTVAVNLHNEIWEEQMNGDTVSELVSCNCLMIMKSWPTMLLLSEKVINQLKGKDEDIILEFARFLVHCSDIEDALDEFWTSVMQLVVTGGNSLTKRWLTFFLQYLKKISITSMKVRSKPFILFVSKMIDLTANGECEKQDVNDFLVMILQIVVTSDINAEESCITVTEMAVSCVEHYADIKIPFQLIKQLTQIGLDASSTDHQERILFQSLKLLSFSCQRYSSNEFSRSTGLANLDMAISNFEVIFCCLDNLINTAHARIKELCYTSFVCLLAHLNSSQVVALLSKKLQLRNAIVQNFFSFQLIRPYLEFVVGISMHPDLKDIWFGLVYRLFYHLFDCEPTDNSVYLADAFIIYTDALISGRCNFLLGAFKERKYDLFTGITHKVFYIRESCVNALVFLMDLDADIHRELMTKFDIEPAIKETNTNLTSGRSYSNEGRMEVDLLSMYYKNSQQADQKSWNVSKDSFDREFKKLDSLFSKDEFESTDRICSNKEKTCRDCPVNLKSHIPLTAPLVETDTLLKNLTLVMSVVNNPVNLLLQGPTGVGKTAVITEAARRFGIPLIRFNMSSSTTIANIFGSAVPQEKDGVVTVQFQEGPFTTAFTNGAWLLLDEFNLAPDNVLSCIENALDTSILFLSTESAEVDNSGPTLNEKRYLEYKRNDHFRLFCTQNPNSGLFKGKREKHSSTLLSRFTPVMIDGPSKTEVKTIIKKKFIINDINDHIAAKATSLITDIHYSIQKLFDLAEFTERNCAYSEVTLRDVMRWAERAISKLQNVTSLDSSARNALANMAWSIYGSRLRISENKKSIEEIIFKSLQSTATSLRSDVNIALKFSHEGGFLSTDQDQFPFSFGTLENDKHNIFCNKLYHNIVPKIILKAFNDNEITRLGFHFFESISSTMKSSYLDLKGRLVHVMRQMCYVCTNKLQKLETFDYIKKLAKEVYNVDVYNDDLHLDQDCPKECIALTEEMKLCWEEILTAFKYRQPVLLTGKSGCGKSEIVSALGTVMQKKMMHLYITPETDPEILVGNFVPSGQGVKWKEGIVTQAVRNGYWLILENLSEAQSIVLERLNPILENPPNWTVTENIELGSENVPIHTDFRIIATMTPPVSSRSTERMSGANVPTNYELSPALYNRFVVLNIDNQHDNRKALNQIYSAISGDSQLMSYRSQFIAIFLALRVLKSSLNLWHFSRAISGACKLLYDHGMDALTGIFVGIDMNLLCLFKTSTEIYQKALSEVKKQFPQFKEGVDNFAVKFQDKSENSSYVIDKEKSATQYKNACILSAAIACNFPTLLEGPAATGKTSLISFLADCNQCPLERVNNTENTSISDYLGVVLPDGSYAPGPLVRAMQKGYFFLADEFDLAEPAVLNMLYPLLEGKRTIMLPSTNDIVMALPSFRFFATQNGSGYAGRKDLPNSLRSRLTEVTFQDFSELEIKYIIEARSVTFNQEIQAEIWQNAGKLAKAYHIINKHIARSKTPLFGSGIKITIREILKWINRKAAYMEAEWGLLGFQMLYMKTSENNYQLLASLLLEAFPQCVVLQNYDKCKPSVIINRKEQKLMNCHGEKQDLPMFKVTDANFWDMLEKSPPKFLEYLWNLCIAAYCREPILLTGPTSCKSHLIDTWAEMYQREDDKTVVLCNSSSDSADLLGRLRPFSQLETFNYLFVTMTQFLQVAKTFIKEHVKELQHSLKWLNAYVDNELSITLEDFKNVITEINLTIGDNQEDIDFENMNRIMDVENVSILHQYANSDTDASLADFCGYSDTSSSSSDNESIGISSSESEKEASFKSSRSSSSSTISSLHSFQHDEDLNDKVQAIGNSDEESDSDYCEEFSDLSVENELSVVKITSKAYECLQKLKEAMDHFMKILQQKLPSDSYLDIRTLSAIAVKFDATFDQGMNEKQHNSMTFIFQDGPCSKAIKEGRILILEDVNLPSQAVTERLNSVLEIQPSFCLFEDLSLKNQCSLSIPAKLAIFGTVHDPGTGSKKINLSPAIRSRMTEVSVTAYSDSELVSLSTLSTLEISDLSKEFEHNLFSIIGKLQKHINITSRDIMKLKSFVVKQLDATAIFSDSHFKQILVLGINFLWLDQIKISNGKIKEAIFKTVIKVFGLEYHDIRSFVEGKEYNNDSREWAAVVQKEHCSFASLSDTPFKCSLAPGVHTVKSIANLCLSKTTFKNICRIFASAECEMKLLLNGPPGIGKTKIIEELSTALGYECCRINFSSNTTYEDLIGTFIPKVINGKRCFDFVEGKLLKAIRCSAKTWILLDEINLAHPTVLEKLIPLFASHKSLRIDATGEVVQLDKIHIFATKNPETVGGGRNKLPDSVLSHFTTINLSVFSDEELKQIGRFKMEEPMEHDDYYAIPKEQVNNILDFQEEVSKAADCKIIGNQANPVSFNLRDLVKFIRVAETNAEFHKLAVKDKLSGQHDEGHKTAIEIEGIRINLELIYTKSLKRKEDRKEVRSLIDKYFPPQSMIPNDVVVDFEHNMEKFVRIGFIYLKKGFANRNTTIPFFHTNFTNSNLVSLSTAIRTGHTILLQGGNSSGKTSLVSEIAKLAKRNLITLQMTKETTVSDLIGSWTVGNEHVVQGKLKVLIKGILENLITSCIMCKSKNNQSFAYLKEFYLTNKLFFTVPQASTDVYVVAKQVCATMEKIVDVLDSSCPELDKIQLDCNQVKELLDMKSSDSGSNFIFVEGPLMEAIRKGNWILLDNIGQAPGDVLERLNSLAEADPQLILYEGGKNEILTRKNMKIHNDFRMFATFNTERSKGNALSNAFYNRCIVINISPYDEPIGSVEDTSSCSTELIKNAPAYDIICKQLGKIHGSEFIVKILVKLHFHICKLSGSRSLETIGGYKYSFRNLLMGANTLLNLIRTELRSVPEALTIVVNRCYCDPLVKKEDRKLILRYYLQILKEEIENIPEVIQESFLCSGSTCAGDDLAALFGDFVSNITLYILMCFRRVDSFPTKNEKVSANLENIFVNLQKVLDSYQDEMKNLTIEITYDGWMAFGSHSQAAKYYTDMLKRAGVIKSDIYENFDYVQKSIEKKSENLCNKLLQYLHNTTFFDAFQRNAHITSLIQHCVTLEDISESLSLILKNDKDLIDSMESFTSAVKKLTVGKAYVNVLKEVSKSGYDYVLHYMTKIIDESVKSERKADTKIQKRSHTLVNIEKAFHLPIMDGLEVRKKAIEEMFLVYPDAVSNVELLHCLAKIEFWSLKLACLCITPNIFLQRSRAMEKLSIFTLTNMNSMCLLEEITASLIKQFEKIKELRHPLQKIKKLAAEHEMTSDVISLRELVRHIPDDLSKDEGNSVSKELQGSRDLLEDMMRITSTVTMLREGRDYQDMKHFVELTGIFLREEIINEWCKTYNKQQRLNMSASVFGSSLLDHNISEKISDIICLFGIVLEDLSSKGFWLQLYVANDVDSNEDLSSMIFTNVTHHFLTIIVPFTGSTVIIDRSCLLNISNNTFKIYVCSFLDEDKHLQSLLNSIQSTFQQNSYLNEILLLKIDCPELLPDKVNFFFPSFVLKMFFYERELFTTGAFNFTEKDLQQLLCSIETFLNITESKQPIQEDRKSELSIISSFALINDAISLIEENENSGYNFDKVLENLSKLERHELSEMGGQVKRAYKEISNAIQPKDLVEKALLFSVMKANGERLSWMKVKDRIEDGIVDNHVNQYIIVFDLIEKFQENINKLYKYSVSMHPYNMHKFCVKATDILLNGFKLFISNINVSYNEIKSICGNLVNDLIHICNEINEFLKHSMLGRTYEEIRFNIDSVAYLLKEQEESLDQSVQLPQVTEEVENKKRSWISKIDNFQEELNALYSKAAEYNLHGLLQDIGNIITDANLLRLNLCKESEKQFNNLKRLTLLLKEDINISCQEIDDERNLDPFAIKGIVKINSPINIAESEMTITDPSHHSDSDNLSEMLELKQICMKLNVGKSKYDVSNFEQVFMLYLACMNTRRALEIAHKSIALLFDDDLPDAIIKQTLCEQVANMNLFVNSLCLLHVSNLKILLLNEPVDLKDVKQRLFTLTCLLQEEHFNALEQLRGHNFDELYHLVSMTTNDELLNLGCYSHRVKNLTKCHYILLRYLQQPVVAKQILQPDFLYPNDFLIGLTNSTESIYRMLNVKKGTEILSEESILDELKSFFNAESGQVFTDNFIQTFTYRIFDRITSILNLSKKFEDSNSPAFTTFSNINLVDICCIFWSLIDDGIEKLTKLEFHEQVTLLADNSSKGKYEFEKRILEESKSKLLKSYAELRADFEEKKRCHEKTVNTMKGYTSITGIDSAFDHHSVKKQEELQWRKECCSFEQRSAEMLHDIDEVDLKHNNLKMKYELIFIETFQELVIIIRKYAIKLTSIYSGVLEIIGHCFAVESVEETTESNRLSSYLKSEEFYQIMYRISDTDKLMAVKEKLLILQDEVYELKEEFVTKSANLLGTGSKINKILGRILCIGNCSLSSISRSIHSLYERCADTTEEKDIRRSYADIVSEIMNLVHNIMKDSQLTLKPDQFDALVDVHERLWHLYSRALSSKKIYRVNVSHLARFFSRFILYCIHQTGDIKNSKIMASLLTESGLSTVPTDQSQVKILHNRILAESCCIYPEMRSVSIYALAEEVLYVWDILNAEPDTKDFSLEDELKITRMLMVRDLINVSNFSDILEKHFDIIVNQFNGHSLTKQESQSLRNAVQCLEKLVVLSCQSSVGNSHDVSCELARVTCEYTCSKEMEVYGCCLLQDYCKVMMEAITIRRGNLKSRLQGIVDASIKLSFFLSRLVLNQSFHKMLNILVDSKNKDVIVTDLQSLYSSIPYNFKLSSLFREYCYNALKEIKKLGNKRFKDATLYSSSNIRFHEFILSGSKQILTVCDYICKGEPEINAYFEDGQLSTSLPGMLEFQTARKFEIGYYAGQLFHLSNYIKSLRRKLQYDSTEKFKTYSNQWMEATNVLFTMREAMKDSEYEKQACVYEKEKEEIIRQNESRMEHYETKCSEFKRKKEEITDMFHNALTAVFLSFMKLNDVEGAFTSSDKNRFLRLTKRFYALMETFISNSILPNFMHDIVWFKSSATLSIVFQYVLISKTKWKKIKSSFNKHGLCLLLSYNSYEERIDVPQAEKSGKVDGQIRIKLSHNFVPKLTNEEFKYVVKVIILVEKSEIFHEEISLLYDKEAKWAIYENFYDRNGSCIDFRYEYNVDIMPNDEEIIKFKEKDDDIFEKLKERHLFDLFDDCESCLTKLNLHSDLKEPKNPTILDIPAFDSKPTDDFATASNRIPLHILITQNLEVLYNEIDHCLSNICTESVSIVSAIDGMAGINPTNDLNLKSLVQYGYSLKETLTSINGELKTIHIFIEEYKKAYEKLFCKNNKVISGNQDLLKDGSFLKQAYRFVLMRDKLLPFHNMFTAQQKKIGSNILEVVIKFKHLMSNVHGDILCVLMLLSNLMKCTILHEDCNSLDEILTFLDCVVSKTNKRSVKEKVRDGYNHLKEKRSLNKSHLSDLAKLKNTSLILPELEIDSAKLKLSKVLVIDLEKLLVNEMAEQPCLEVDLGKVVQGLCSNQSSQMHLLLNNNTDNDYHYCFVTKTTFVLPTAEGVVESHGQERLRFLLSNKALNIGEFREEATLKITSTLEYTFSIFIKQTVERFAAELVIKDLQYVKSEAENFLAMDVGDVSQNRMIERCFDLENPYDVPLRVKFVSMCSHLQFDINEHVIKVKEKVTQKITFTTKICEGEEMKARIYFSETLFITLKVNYKASKPEVEVTLDNRIIDMGYFSRKAFNVAPGSIEVYEGFKILNKSDLSLTVCYHEIESNSFTIKQANNYVIKSNESYIPEMIICPKIEGDDAFVLNVDVKEMDGFILKKIPLKIFVKANWPRLEVYPSRLAFNQCEVGTEVKKTLKITAKKAIVRISSVSGDAVFGDLCLPMDIHPNKYKDLTMTIVPSNDTEFTTSIKIRSNCENQVLTHNIKCAIEMSMLCSSPTVVNVGNLLHNKKFSLVLSNHGNLTKTCYIENKAYTRHLIKLTSDNMFLRLTKGDQQTLHCTVELNRKNNQEKLFGSFSGLIKFGATFVVPVIGHVDHSQQTKLLDCKNVLQHYCYDVALLSANFGILLGFLKLEETEWFAMVVSPFLCNAFINQEHSLAKRILECVEKGCFEKFLEIIDSTNDLKFKKEILEILRKVAQSISEKSDSIAKLSSSERSNIVVKLSDLLPWNSFSMMLRLLIDISKDQTIKVDKAIALLLQTNAFICSETRMTGVAQKMLVLRSIFLKTHISSNKPSEVALLNLSKILKSTFFEGNKACQTVSQLLSIARDVRKEIFSKDISNSFIQQSFEMMNSFKFADLENLLTYLKDVKEDSRSIIEAVNEFFIRSSLDLDVSSMSKLTEVLKDIHTEIDISLMNEALSEYVDACQNMPSLENITHIAGKIMSAQSSSLQLDDFEKKLMLFSKPTNDLSLNDVVDVGKMICYPGDFMETYSVELEKIQVMTNGIGKLSLSTNRAYEYSKSIINFEDDECYRVAIELTEKAQKYGEKICESKDVSFDAMLQMAEDVLGKSKEHSLHRASQCLKILVQYGKNVLHNLKFNNKDIIETATELNCGQKEGDVSKYLLLFTNQIQQIMTFVSKKLYSSCIEFSDGLKTAFENIYLDRIGTGISECFNLIHNVTGKLMSAKVSNLEKIGTSAKLLIKKCSNDPLYHCMAEVVHEACAFFDQKNMNEIGKDRKVKQFASKIKVIMGSHGISTACNMEECLFTDLVENENCGESSLSTLSKKSIFKGIFSANDITPVIHVFQEISTVVELNKIESESDKLLMITKALFNSAKLFSTQTVTKHLQSLYRLISDIFGFSRANRNIQSTFVNKLVIEFSISDEMKNLAKICNFVLSYRASLSKTMTSATQELFQSVSQILTIFPAPKDVVEIVRCSGFCYKFCQDVIQKRLCEYSALCGFVYNMTSFSEFSSAKELVLATKSVIYLYNRDKENGITTVDILQAVCDMKINLPAEVANIPKLLCSIAHVLGKPKIVKEDLDLLRTLSALPCVNPDVVKYVKLCLFLHDAAKSFVEEVKESDLQILSAEVISILDEKLRNNCEFMLAINLQRISCRDRITSEIDYVHFLDDVIDLFNGPENNFSLMYILYTILFKLNTCIDNLCSKRNSARFMDIYPHIMSMLKYLEERDVSESLASAVHSTIVILDQKEPITTVVSMALLQSVTGKVTLELQQEYHNILNPNGQVEGCIYNNSLLLEKDVVPISNDLSEDSSKPQLTIDNVIIDKSSKS